MKEAEGLFNDSSCLLREQIIEVVRNLPATKYAQKVMHNGMKTSTVNKIEKKVKVEVVKATPVVDKKHLSESIAK